MTIDKDKTYRTRDGHEVRIYATDGSDDLPIHGAVQGGAKWRPMTWRATGKQLSEGAHPLDLIEVRPRHKREVWINVYPAAVRGYPTRHEADHQATSGRIACLHRVFDFEEGEGLAILPPAPKDTP